MNEKTVELNGAVPCKYCGADIMFLKSKKGKWYAVDTACVPDGSGGHELVPMRGHKTGMTRFHKCEKKVNQ